jgi:hypothetical protein
MLQSHYLCDTVTTYATPVTLLHATQSLPVYTVALLMLHRSLLVRSHSMYGRTNVEHSRTAILATVMLACCTVTTYADTVRTAYAPRSLGDTVTICDTVALLVLHGHCLHGHALLMLHGHTACAAHGHATLELAKRKLLY